MLAYFIYTVCLWAYVYFTVIFDVAIMFYAIDSWQKEEDLIVGSFRQKFLLLWMLIVVVMLIAVKGGYEV